MSNGGTMMKKIYKRENQNLFGVTPNQIGLECCIMTGNFAKTQREREELVRRQRRR